MDQTDIHKNTCSNGLLVTTKLHSKILPDLLSSLLQMEPLFISATSCCPTDDLKQVYETINYYLIYFYSVKVFHTATGFTSFW